MTTQYYIIHSFPQAPRLQVNPFLKNATMNDNLDSPLIQLGNTNNEDEVTATSRRKPLILVGLSILLVVAVSTASFFSYGAGVRASLTTFEMNAAPAVPNVGEEDNKNDPFPFHRMCMKPGTNCAWYRPAPCCNKCHCGISSWIGSCYCT